jgi:RNA polymerase sigma-70 factor (ECF subfamily)
LTERDFIEELKKGRREAYSRLLDLLGDKIYSACAGLLQDREDAEDITQEVFAEVFRSVGNFRGDSSLETWIRRIAVTKSLELIRNRQRAKRFGKIISLFGKEDLVGSLNPGAFQHPGVNLENRELSAVLFSAIRQLPANQRTAFTLHKLEGFSYNEIAEAMQVSVSSVESLMFRAKSRLRQLLGRYYEENIR